MPVETPSPQYADMAARWQIARDCIAGSHAIKAAGPAYLPPLAGHRPSRRNDPYWSYVERALFYGATGRTIDGLIGMVFRRPPVVESAAGSEQLLSNIDLMGRSVEEFAKASTYEVLALNRAGLLVDHTRADVKEKRPYWRLYTAEAILDVVEDVVGGAVVPVQVRLKEAFVRPNQGGEDEFDVESVEQVRVLDLKDGVYRQRVFRQVTAGGPYVVVEEIVPTIDGQTLDAIPFWILSANDAGRPNDIEPPTLMDLMEVNLTHYRQQADYQYALHMAGVPTFVVSGMPKPPSGTVKVGAAEVFFMPDPGAKAYFVSYGAEGAGAIRQALDDLQQMMAFLGSRMLQPDKRMAEAAETAQIHRMGEISVLGSITNALNARLTAALQLTLLWGLHKFDPKEVSIAMNDDFLPTMANPQLLAEMVKAWQASAISHDSLWTFLQDGEIVHPRRTIDEERQLIEDETPEVAEIGELQPQGTGIGAQAPQPGDAQATAP